MADYTVKRFSEMEAIYGGAMRRARASLGVKSFGMQLLELPPGSTTGYPEHDHIESGQEEVYVVLKGFAVLLCDGETVRLDAESAVRVGPACRRAIVETGSEGALLLMVGGVPGGVYEPPVFTDLGEPDPAAPERA